MSFFTWFTIFHSTKLIDTFLLLKFYDTSYEFYGLLCLSLVISEYVHFKTSTVS